MKATLIRWLGAVPKSEYDALEFQLNQERELLNRAHELLDTAHPTCTKTEGCWMRDGHGGGCRE